MAGIKTIRVKFLALIGPATPGPTPRTPTMALPRGRSGCGKSAADAAMGIERMMH
jgi:hypothetical protein